MIVKDFIKAIDKFAPFSLSENWDNTGLLIGSKNAPVKGVVTALDSTDSVIKYAISKNANLIVSHHPLLFSPKKDITDDDGVGSLILKLIKNDINLIAVHTNLDKSTDGLNQYLACAIGLNNIKPLIKQTSMPYVKFVVYIPETHIDVVRDSICNAGAGCIGDYSSCTFSSAGNGTFLPGNNTTPFIGKAGEMEFVNEVKLETICDRNNIIHVISEMQKVHPYEETAYDIIPLENKEINGGLGRIGELAASIILSDFVEYLEKILGNKLTVCGEKDKVIKKIALCTGSGGDLWEKAASANADLYITSEVKHHQYLLARQIGMAIIDAGHFATEIFAAKILHDELCKVISGTDIYIADEKSPVW